MWIDFYKKPHRLKQRISFGKESGGGAKLAPGPDTEFSQLCRNREGRATSRMAARLS